MKKVERANTLKVVASLESSKRFNLNTESSLFFSEPPSILGTPTTPSRPNLRLEPLSRSSFTAKKPTVQSLSSDQTPSSMVKDSTIKLSQFTKENSGSDSHVTTRLDSGNSLVWHLLMKNND